MIFDAAIRARSAKSTARYPPNMESSFRRCYQLTSISSAKPHLSRWCSPKPSPSSHTETRLCTYTISPAHSPIVSTSLHSPASATYTLSTPCYPNPPATDQAIVNGSRRFKVLCAFCSTVHSLGGQLISGDSAPSLFASES